MSSGFSYVKPASGELGTFTKAQLDTAVTDGNVVFVGDALNGTLGATTPASVAATTGAFSDQLSLSHSPAVSESVIVLTGAVQTGGTSTTNFPAILCQPTGTTAATAWSTGGTWFGVNAASGFTGRFIDFRVNGAAGVFSVNSAGWLNMSGVFASSRTSTSGTAAVSYTGSVFTGGTGTTNLPHILAEPSGTTAATTWSTSGTFVGINAASGYAGNFIDLRLNGGASLFAVTSGGVVNATGFNGTVGATTPASVAATTGSFSGVITATSTGTHTFGTTNTVTITNGLLTATASSSIGAAITVGATGSGNTFSLFANAGAGAAGIKTDGFKNFDFRNCTTVTFTNIAPEGILSFTTVGKSITYKSGTGQRAGNATLVSGTVTVTNTSITANSVIILSRKTAGGTIGDLTYTLSAGASFTINSANILDTSVVSYLIQEVV